MLQCCGNAVLQSEERIAHGAERIHPSSRLVRDYGGQLAPGVKSFKGGKKDQDERFEVGGKEVLQLCC